MMRAVTAWTLSMDLEKRFIAWLSLLLLLAGATFMVLDTHYSSLIVAIGTMGAVGSIAFGAAHFALFRPLRRLVAMARAVGARDFSKRLRFARNDDLGSLAHEMDAMCDQLERAEQASDAHIAALEQLRHSDRVATLGRLASSVAHELGNPLNVIELRAQLICDGDVATLARAQQSAVVILEQTRRMTRIIDEILSFARVQPVKLERIDLNSVLRKAIALCEHTAKKHRANIELVTPPGPLDVRGNADTLLQVLVNLVINAAQSMPSGGDVRVSTGAVRRAPIDDSEGTARDYTYIDVMDHGDGMAEDVLAKVFEPFFSTKSAEGGTGLGLSVAQGIARDHDGWIDAASVVGHGSSFKVYLPMLATPSSVVAHAS
jgi:signal transduction histidine kinase